MCGFDSDSEYVWLLLIHTPLSYNLNLITVEPFSRRAQTIARFSKGLQVLLFRGWPMWEDRANAG